MSGALTSLGLGGAAGVGAGLGTGASLGSLATGLIDTKLGQSPFLKAVNAMTGADPIKFGEGGKAVGALDLASDFGIKTPDAGNVTSGSQATVAGPQTPSIAESVQKGYTDPVVNAQGAKQASPQGTGNPAYRQSIANIESSGGNYRLIGPETKGDRPYGKYQVMGANVGPWTKEALGREMSPAEFLKNEAAQDAVFDKKFGQYVEKYGEKGASEAWFGGEGSVGKPGRKDILGTSVGSYGQRFIQGLNNGGSQPATPQGSPLERVFAAAAAGEAPQVGVAPQGTTAAPQQQAAPQTPMERVMASVASGSNGKASKLAATAQEGAALPQAGEAVDLGAEEIAGLQQSLAQRSMAPTDRATQRRQKLAAAARGQRA